MDLFTTVFGEGKELTSLQIGSRTIIMYVIALFLIRLAGLKTFGKNSAFDNIIIIMLGAILSRGVVGASPFFGVVLSGLLLVLMSRAISWICIRNKRISAFIKGEHICLYEKGEINRDNLTKNLLSKDDLMESVRLEANTKSLEDIEEVFLECNGELSVIKKKKA